MKNIIFIEKSMDSSDDNSDSELFLTAAGGYEFPPVPEHSQLKPKLDSIFAEVEKNLPSIDFDLSDVRKYVFLLIYR